MNLIMKHMVAGLLAMAIFAAVAAGCQPSQQGPEEKQPVSLTFLTSLSKEDFEEEFGKPLREQFAHIELIYQFDNSKGMDPIDYNADLRHYEVGGTYFDIDYKLNKPFPAADLTPYIDDGTLNAQAVDPTMWQQIVQLGDGVRIASFPYSSRLSALYYNKEAFADLGLEAPAAGWLWDDVLNTLMQLPPDETDSMFGNMFYDLAHQLSIPLYRHDSDEAAIADKFTHVVNLYDDASRIAGNPAVERLPDPGYMQATSQNLFKSMSMRTVSGIQYLLLNPQLDVAPFPSFAHLPGVGPRRIYEALQINENSEHREEAAQVIRYLTSEPFQLRNAARGIAPVLHNSEMYASFAGELGALADKQLSSFFYNGPPASMPPGELLEQDAVETAVFDMNRILGDLYAKRIDKETALEQLLQVYRIFQR